MFSRKKGSRLNLTKNQNAIFKYRREVIGVLLIGLFLVLILSLISFNPLDPSWFYYATDATKPTNWIGCIGAHLAAFFFYLFGSPAYICIFILLFFILVRNIYKLPSYSLYIIFYIPNTLSICPKKSTNTEGCL